MIVFDFTCHIKNDMVLSFISWPIGDYTVGQVGQRHDINYCNYIWRSRAHNKLISYTNSERKNLSRKQLRGFQREIMVKV